MNRKREQIQERREFGKASLYRRGRADSVIRLGSNLFAGEYFSACVSSSHLSYFIETPELKRHCFYKKSSGYFIFFPASGYRNYSDGNLYNSGTNGYGWTSTPYNSSNAWNLNFNSGNANMNNNNRGNGFPVRCVQASAPVFVFTKDTFVFFPAAGQRHDSNGRLDAFGIWGLVVSSTSSDGRAWTLEFHAGGASVYADFPSRGYSVRCVQASAPVFVFAKDTFVFFPAAGYRHYDSGSLNNSGTQALVWSSVPSGESAYRLYSSPTGAFVTNVQRTYGFSVRCVQASAAVFAFIRKDMEEALFFFPAAGLRDSSDGKLGWSGSWGGCWTSTSFGNSSCWLLSVAPGRAYVGPDSGALGLPVRCVQASAAVWAVRKENIKQIRFRRESGKACLCRRGQADSVTRLGRKLSASENHFVCAAPSYLIMFIKLPVFNCLYFYKHSSGYFLFFPASGYRDYRSGSLGDSGSNGYGWTSVVSGDNACYLYFSFGAAYIGIYYRDYGRPVRCVQASAFVFVFIRKDIEDALFFFPASGNREYNDGSLVYLGMWGHGWSSSPSDGTNAWFFRFSSGVVHVYSGPRTHGLSVRCVQASATVFAFSNYLKRRKKAA